MDFNKLLNRAVLDTKPSGIRKYFDIAEKMENVISLGVGEPDFATPWHIRQAGIQSLEDKKTRYTANRGIVTLRNEVSKYLKRKYNLCYNADSDILIKLQYSIAAHKAFFSSKDRASLLFKTVVQ